MRFVPENIVKPEYALSGYPTEEMDNKQNKAIEVKTPEEIQNMREACLIGSIHIYRYFSGRKALDLGHSIIKPGITTDEIDRVIHQYIISQNAYPSPLNYHNFPKSLCTYIPTFFIF